MRAGFEAQLEKFAAEDKAISVEIQGFEVRIKEAEAKVKDREKEKLGTKATLAALEIELQSSVQQVPSKPSEFKPEIRWEISLTRSSSRTLMRIPAAGYR